MNKEEFLNKLVESLSGLPQNEVQKTVDYYSEIIDDAVENGENEQEVIARIGNIDTIVEKIIDDTPIRKFVKEDMKQRKPAVATVVLLIVCSPIWLPLLIAIFAIAISLYLSIWAIIASIFAVFAALALSGIALIVSTLFALTTMPLKAFFIFGAALICIGLSVFIFFLSLICAKLIIKFTIFIGRKIKERFIRRGGIVHE